MTIKSPLSMQKHCKKGFTLTEIAIVLGIIGLILGAVWTAASGVYASTNASNFSNIMTQYIAAVRSACNNNCAAVPTVTIGIPDVTNSGAAIATGASVTVPGDLLIQYTMPATMNKYANTLAQGLSSAANVTGSFFGPAADVVVVTPKCTTGTATVKTSPTCVAPAGYSSTFTANGTAAQCTGSGAPASPTGSCSVVTTAAVTAGTTYTFGFSQSF